MKRIYLILSALCLQFSFTKAEENIEYKQIPVLFERLETDTLDHFIVNYGKDSLLNNIDSTINVLKNIIKYSTENIKNEEILFQLKGINQHFKLELDLSLSFNSNYVMLDSTINRVYELLIGDTTKTKKDLEKFKLDKVDIYSLIAENIHQIGYRRALYTYCNYFDFIDYRYLDTLYKASLIYPNDVKNEFYYSLIEFDRNCGNPTNNSKDYKDLLYNKMKGAMSLEKALSDTNKVSTLNYTQYLLTSKYQFLAYSLYSKNFDIKANQKEIIYFLASQNKTDGGFKEFNIKKDDRESSVEPSFYALWSLLELREQIDKIYN